MWLIDLFLSLLKGETVANTLTTLEYAIVQDGNGTNLGGGYSAVSSNPAVASISTAGGPAWIAVVGQSAGTADITVTRNTDGVKATLTATVTAAGGFTIQLATPVTR